jgi:outer membrane protein TolC
LARAGVARADLYPKFFITGLGGRQSTDFSGLTLGGGNYFSVGPAVSLPIFNFGRIRAHIAQQDAELQVAVHQYEQDVIGAFEETENALVSRSRANERRAGLEAQVEAAKSSIDLAQELYIKGLGDYLSVLDAQRQLFQAERQLADARAAQLRAALALFKSLGA